MPQKKIIATPALIDERIHAVLQQDYQRNYEERRIKRLMRERSQYRLQVIMLAGFILGATMFGIATFHQTARAIYDPSCKEQTNMSCAGLAIVYGFAASVSSFGVALANDDCKGARNAGRRFW